MKPQTRISQITLNLATDLPLPDPHSLSVNPCHCSTDFLFGQIWQFPYLFFIFRKEVYSMTEKLPEITDEEREIIKLVRNIGFGKIVVTVKNGKPVFVETQKTIQLTGNK